MAEFLVELADLAANPRPVAEVGGKAENLGRLIAAGLPIPPGFVILAGAPASMLEPAGAELDQITTWAESLDLPLIVRSSASIEDSAEGAAPGLFSTVRDVTREGLAAAIAEVAAAASSETVAAYLATRELDRVDLAIIVQQQIPAAIAGGAYSRPPGQPHADSMLIEARSGAQSQLQAIAEVSRETLAVVTADRGFSLEPEETREIAKLVLAAEEALGVGGVDVEWLLGDRPWLVQARPIPPLVAAGNRPPPDLFEFSRAEPHLTWRWDASHNPDPLSPAQASLVERVDRAGLAPYRQLVVAGYLYTAEEDDRKILVTPPVDPESLRREVDDHLRPQIEAALATVEDQPAPSLDDALAAFDEVYRCYTTMLAPLLGSVRRQFSDLLGQLFPEEDAERLAGQLLESRSLLDRLLGQAAAGEISLLELQQVAAPLAPAWDVAEPTYGENLALLERAIARRSRAPRPTRSPVEETRRRVPAELRSGFDLQLELATLARSIGEADDLVFGRAQNVVRRALLTTARRWRLVDSSEIFWLPLDRITSAPASDHQQAVAAARQRHAEQRATAMPLAFRNGMLLELGEPGSGFGGTAHRHCWQGRGFGGCFRGVVVQLEDLESATLPENAILVVGTITPAMTFLVQGVRCIVSEHGGLLDHGAAMARELGIGCVVGCTGVRAHLACGDHVWVNCEAGLVIRLKREV